MTPAQKAGLTNKQLDIGFIVNQLEDPERPKTRGPYKPRVLN